MADLKVIDLLGARARIIRCSGKERVTEDVSLPPKGAIHSTMLLPAARGDCFTVGESTDIHRRGRALSWPMEAQSPPGGVIANGNGRVYAEAVLRSFATDRLGDRTFTWKPDGVTESAVSADTLLGDSLKGELTHESEVGLVVPDGLKEEERQAVIDACSPHGKVWLIPRTMAAAIAWCRSKAVAPLLIGKSDENVPIGHILLIEAVFGLWAMTAVPIFRVTRGKKNWLVPKREARFRKVVEGLTGWGLLARQAAHHQGRSALTRMNDPKWVLDILDGEQALMDECVNKPMPDEDVLPQMPGLDGGKIWHDGARRLASEASALMAGIESPCLGGEMVGALAGVKKQGGYLRDQLLSAFRLKHLDVTDDAVSAGGALAMVSKENGTPTWFENLETIHLFFKDKNKLGDPIPGWEPLLPGKQMDAGRDYQSEQPIDKFSIPAGRNTITLTLQHTHEKGQDYRRSTTAQSEVCVDETPILISVHAKPGQGFAVVTVNSKMPGFFAGRLDWRKMEKCDEPKIKYAYTPTAKLVAVEGLWAGVSEHMDMMIASLEGGRRSDGLVEAIKRFTATMNRCIHSEANLPDRWKVRGEEKGRHIYYAPVSLEGQAPNQRVNALLDRLHQLLVDQVINGDDGFTFKQKRELAKLRSAASRAMAWRYHGCPRDVLQVCVTRLGTGEKLSVLDLHVLGLGLKERDEILMFMHRLRDDLPGMKGANNWLRAFRNIVRLNEHALRDVSDEDSYDIVDALLEKLNGAVEAKKKTVASNCLESLLFALKRRRYSPAFMAKNEDRANCLMGILNAGRKVEEGGPGYSRAAMSFMAEKNLKFAASLVRFLNEDATNEDITITSSLDDEGEDDEDE